MLFLVGMVLAIRNLGMFGFIILGVFALVMLPIVIAIVFSIWAGTRPSAPADAMTLHFAYGSNMSRPLMRARCPRRDALGTATLSRLALRHQPRRLRLDRAGAGRHVHGVLWRLTARDLAAINAYESLRRRALPAADAAGAASTAARAGAGL